MSRLRKEKNCLNCGHIVEEAYCTHCGQKNIETHVNAFHALLEFAGDYFHADGKFLKSILPLLFRPGYMTNEYNAGRREKFIHPFRLYIFISIVYFTVSLLVPEEAATNKKSPLSNARITIGKSGIRTFQNTDSLSAQEDSGIAVLNARAKNLPASIKEYRDSVRHLDRNNRPSFTDDISNRVAIKYKASGDAGGLLEATAEKFRHALPKLLFFLLPLAALLLKLFYIRRKRFYIDHLVHTLHLHSFIFLALTLYSLLMLFGKIPYVLSIVVIAIILYFFVSMKRVYQQSRRKTILKGILFIGSYLFCLAIIFGAGFLYIFIYE